MYLENKGEKVVFLPTIYHKIYHEKVLPTTLYFIILPNFLKPRLKHVSLLEFKFQRYVHNTKILNFQKKRKNQANDSNCKVRCSIRSCDANSISNQRNKWVFGVIVKGKSPKTTALQNCSLLQLSNVQNKGVFRHN